MKWQTGQMFATQKDLMSLIKNIAEGSNDMPTPKTRQKTAKVKTQTVVPEGMVIQVHERPIPPETYRICNGTTFGTYQPKPWGR